MLQIYMDLDDTLIQTQQLFEQYKTNCMNYILTHEGSTNQSKEEVMAYFNNKEISNIKKYGFKNERFIISWQETFTHFIPNHSSDKIGELAGRVFEEVSPIKDGAIQALDELKELGYEITIITCGVDEVQNKRIDDVGLRHYFKEVYVVPYKDKQIMGDIIQDRENSVMVGNSMRSDIFPSLQIGIPAIQIEAPNWFHDEMDIVPDGEYYYCKIEEVPEVISLIEAKKETVVKK